MIHIVGASDFKGRGFPRGLQDNGPDPPVMGHVLEGHGFGGEGIEEE